MVPPVPGESKFVFRGDIQNVPRSRQRARRRSYADKAPFALTGEIKQVVFDVAPDLSPEDASALHEHAALALAAHACHRADGLGATRSRVEGARV